MTLLLVTQIPGIIDRLVGEGISFFLHIESLVVSHMVAWKKTTTAIVILGQALDKPSGNLPRSLIGRLQTGWAIASSLVVDAEAMLILLSGADTSKVGVSEANAMRQYAMENLGECTWGNVILEEEAMNTCENALFCTNILINKAKDCCIVHLVTNDFHTPRAKCIFECVFEASHFRHAGLHCHPAPSGHAHGPYRSLSNRPSDVAEWRLCERLDWEHNAILTLNDYLAGYNLGPLTQDRIDKALTELKAMNESSQSAAESVQRT